MVIVPPLATFWNIPVPGSIDTTADPPTEDILILVALAHVPVRRLPLSFKVPPRVPDVIVDGFVEYYLN